jgi:hypothetical protein
MWHWLYSTSNNYVICDDGEGAGLYDGEGVGLYDGEGGQPATLS